MRSHYRPALMLALTVLLILLAAPGAAPGATADGPAAPGGPDSTAPLRAACPESPGPVMRCLTRYAPQTGVNQALAAGQPATPEGWGATDIRSAYNLPDGIESDTLVAVSIAYDAPNLEQDLNVYRQQFGLPPCTTANGCFRKVNQDGAEAPLPEPNFGWAVESTLDVSMVSAACPSCRILVVEANDPAVPNLAATVDTAVRLGARVVSNSYGLRESGYAMRYAAHYDQPGHTIVVASGDFGFTAGSFPAVLDTVTAVGGTTLERAPNPRGWTERVWPYGGSSCSAYVAKPAWQTDTGCRMRTVADVAAVADNVAIYSTEAGGWATIGGTSAAAPIIAGIYGSRENLGDPGEVYRHPGDLFDITSGTNDPNYGGRKCGYDYLCVATTGYDAPTGVGTPNGIGAF